MSETVATQSRSVTPAGRVVPLRRGFPELRPDIWRNLRRAAKRLAAGRVTARVTFYDCPGAVPGLYDEITGAWRDRCLHAGRPADLTGWVATWRSATACAVLRIDGKLAAWLLAAPAEGWWRRLARRRVYLVLAGQMVPGFEAYRPGRLLEWHVLAAALAGGYHRLDWGSDTHPEALITAPSPGRSRT